MKFLKNVTTLFLLVFTCFVQAAPQKKPFRMPEITIKTIKNETDFDITIIDRLTKKEITVPANTLAETPLKIKNYRNVVINGSMTDILAEKSQYVIRKVVAGVAETESEVYLQLHASEGGVDNGSGIITGMPGTIVFNFLMAGKLGGCTMSTRRLQNVDCKVAEFNLRLFINNEKLTGNGEFVEK